MKYEYTFNLGDEMYSTLLESSTDVFKDKESIDTFLQLCFKSGQDFSILDERKSDIFTDKYISLLISLTQEQKLAMLTQVLHVLLSCIGEETLRSKANIQGERKETVNE